VRARRVVVRGIRCQAWREQVALRDWRVQARLNVDHGGPSAHAGPAQQPSPYRLYRCRSSVEREPGQLKDEWAPAPALSRLWLDRVRPHADLTILATALSRAPAGPLAAMATAAAPRSGFPKRWLQPCRPPTHPPLAGAGRHGLHPARRPADCGPSCPLTAWMRARPVVSSSRRLGAGCGGGGARRPRALR
jgi:hypothetical protein